MSALRQFLAQSRAVQVLLINERTIFLSFYITGLAGALFGPALRAYLAAASSGRRAEVFALANLAGQIDTLLGPPVGVVRLAFSFRLVCVAAGVIFLGLMLLQFRYLPRRADLLAETPRPVLRDWSEVLANRGFVRFAV